MPQKAQKKDNLPVTKVDVDLQNGGTISYANEVIATIAGVATNEIDGVAGMCVSGGFSEILSRNRNITRGVKVEVGSQEAAVDLYIIVEYGTPIQKVCAEVQENVRKALEGLTGLHVVRVDVHVQGVSFEKEKKAQQSSIEAAKNPVLTEAEPAPKDNNEEPAEEAPEETPAQDAPAEETAPQEDAEEAAPAEEAVSDEAEAAEEAPAAEVEAPVEAAPADEEIVDGEAPQPETVVEQVNILGDVPAEAEAPEKPSRRRRKKTDDAPAEEEKPAKGPGGRKRA